MNRFAVAAVLAMLLAGAACAPKAAPLSAADTPAQHYLLGMQHLDRENPDAAGAEFLRALQLDPDFGPGWSGQALTFAQRAAAGTDAVHGQADAEQALDMLKRARYRSSSGPEKFIYSVARVRVLALLRPPHWQADCQQAYKDALSQKLDPMDLPYYRDQGAAHAFYGQALILDGRYKEAQQILALAMEPPSHWSGRAQDLFAKAQKIDRAQAQFSLTGLARIIAAKDQVQRADAAALVVNELDIDRLFSGGPLVKAEPGSAGFVPVDAQSHPMASAILDVVSWRVRGLEPLYDPASRAYLFEPAKPLTRKELAFVLEDVVLRATGQNELATRYFSDAQSPFPDVPVTASWYNAAVTAVGRGLMQPDLNGAFRPDDTVDGADLVLSVLRLRQALHP